MKKPKSLLEVNWKTLEDLFLSSTMTSLVQGINKNYQKITPARRDIFKFLNYFDISKTKVCFINMNPYAGMVNGERIATGIPFATKNHTVDTPELKMIRDCLAQDEHSICVENFFDWTFKLWCKQNILMLNASLTSGINGASHLNHWKFFTGGIIEYLITLDSVIFVPVGVEAQRFLQEFNIDKQWVEPVVHPLVTYKRRLNTNLSTHLDFRKSKIFKSINSHLESPIRWINEEPNAINYYFNY